MAYSKEKVRPAFNLNLDSVLFTSAAADGKPGGGLQTVNDYNGSDWKMTLLDNSRAFSVTETTAAGKPGNTLELHYTGVQTGTNEYISVILADEQNTPLYYGRVALTRITPTATQPPAAIAAISALVPAIIVLTVAMVALAASLIPATVASTVILAV